MTTKAKTKTKTKAKPKWSESLTPQEFVALALVGDGADVLYRPMAEHLRSIESKRPDLVVITKVQGTYGPRDRHPYFGAIATPDGQQAILDFLTTEPVTQAGSKSV